MYRAGYLQIPKATLQKGEAAALRFGWTSVAIGMGNGPVPKGKSYQWEGYPAVEVVYSDSLTGDQIRVRAFLVKDRVYMVAVRMPKGEIKSKEANGFLDSFKLLKK